LQPVQQQVPKRVMFGVYQDLQGFDEHGDLRVASV
jgi:hypothetical protein